MVAAQCIRKKAEALMVAARRICRIQFCKEAEAIMAAAICDIHTRLSGTGAGETGRWPVGGRQCTGAEGTLGYGMCPHG